MTPPVLWHPSAQARSSTRLGRFIDLVESRVGRTFDGYDDLWSWSVTDGLEEFWASVWDFFDVRSSTPYRSVLEGHEVVDARWFDGARLNYAEHVCRHSELRPDDIAVVSVSQTRPREELTWRELVDRVARARRGLQDLGVERGDRVAGYLPNITETLVAFLATSSLGAIWTCCSPELGVGAAAERFQQVEPKVLLAVDGYRYGQRDVRRAEELERLRESLPSVERLVMVPYLDPLAVTAALLWSDLLAGPASAEFDAVAPDHPLVVLYSSGTTGPPKAIVHSHAGILVEHMKSLGLHGDMSENDVFFWFTTTSWMMWNYLVSGLLHGARIVLFDGDPGADGPSTLWQLVSQEGITWFGAGAPFFSASRKAGVEPLHTGDARTLRVIGSTGSPLPPEAYRWIYSSVAPDALLSPVSGGTDVCTAFMGGNPLTPVWEGEISCRHLGVAVEAYDADGRQVRERQGELVVVRPMPSMPIGIWGDHDGHRLRRAYFVQFPGVWRHGDWITITDRGSCIISGRSDATLNRGGVRIGTAEIYRVVEALPEVEDSLVVHTESTNGVGAGELVLFLVLRAGVELEASTAAVRQALRHRLSPRHVPDHVFQLGVVPETLTGKKIEVPAKRILGGADPDSVVSRDTLKDPGALDDLVEFAQSPVWRAVRCAES